MDFCATPRRSDRQQRPAHLSKAMKDRSSEVSQDRCESLASKSHWKIRINVQNSCLTNHLKHLYDDCLVWPLKIQNQTVAGSDCGQLVHCTLRIHLSSPCEPDRSANFHCHTTEDHAGVHHPDRLHGYCLFVVRTINTVEPRRFLPAAGRSGLLLFCVLVATQQCSVIVCLWRE
jgi:hypothetical protein